MKIKKHLKVIIILTLLISLSFNFIVPQIALAFDPITLTLGALYTYEVAQALYLTILTATAIGVTFATIDEWKNYHDMIEGTSPGPIEQYPEWDLERQKVNQSKSDLATNHWFDQWDLKLLPGGGQDPEPSNNKKGILAFMGVAGIMGGFFNNFISMFQKLGLEEGDNYVTTGDSSIQVIGNYQFRTYHEQNQNYYVSVNGHTSKIFLMRVGLEGSSISFSNPILIGNNLTFDWNLILSDGSTQSGTVRNYGITNLSPEPIENIDFNIKLNGDSPILGIGEIKYPQPNLIPIPRHNPSTTPELNPDGTPKPGIHRITRPDGTIEERYYGDIDDLIKDVVMNTPIDKILNPDTNPYEIKPGPGHLIITRPGKEPSVPYPQPEPYPYPTPDLPPGINPGEYPGPSPYPPGFPEQLPGQEPGILPGEFPGPGPYPFPQPEPNLNPSPQIPVEPGKQLDYTPWFQKIINWLSLIWNKIPEDKELDQPGELDPPGEVDQPGIDFSPLQGIIFTNKFPFSLPWDIKASFDLLVAEPQAPKWTIPMVTEEIEIDLELFESLALISRSFLSIIFIVMLVILTRRFIGGS